MPGEKFVLDTNIWLSYIISARLKELTEVILNNDLQVYTSPGLIKELSYNFHKEKIKKYISLPIKDYLLQIKNLSINLNPKREFMDSPDPADNFLFDLVIKAKADYLVTGDKRLFQTRIKEVRIIILNEFRNMF